MAEWSFIVGLVGNAISILVFASPIGTFRRVVRNKSTENFAWQPYVTTLMSTSMWTLYGLLKPNGLLVVTVNGAGSVLQAIYVALYISYTCSKHTRIFIAKVVGLLNIGLFGVIVLVTLIAVPGNTRILVMGTLCAGLTVGMYAAPLSTLRIVVKTKSVEYMPFSLSFFLFLNAGIWSAYSLLVRDFFIGIPNAVGFVLGSTQLIIYFIYKKKASSPKEMDIEKRDGEGSTQFIGPYIEMKGERKDEANNSMSYLNKGRILPRPYSARQNTHSEILKTLSLTPYELQSIWKSEEYNAM